MRQQLPSVVLDNLGVYEATTDGNNFYWGERGTAGNAFMDARILAVPITGGTPSVLVDHVLRPTGLETDGVNVYWSDTSGQVSRCAITGCTTPSIVTSSLQPISNGLVTDGTNVYFGTMNGVLECPIAGCGGAPTNLAPATYTPAALSGNTLFLVDGNGIISGCGVAGCSQTPTPIVSAGMPTSIVATSTDVLWVSSYGKGFGPGAELGRCAITGCNGSNPLLASIQQATYGRLAITSGDALWSYYLTVWRCSLSGCDKSPTEVAVGPLPTSNNPNEAGGASTRPVLKGQNIYWLMSTGYDSTAQNTLNNGRIVSCPVCGCNGAPRELVQATSNVVDSRTPLVASGGQAAWLDGAGNVRACSTTSCNGTATTIAEGIPAGNNNALMSAGLATDGTAAYWATNNIDPFTAGASIYSCPLTGCGSSPKLLVGNIPPATSELAVDASSVYWVSRGIDAPPPGVGYINGGVMKLPLGGGVPQMLAAGDLGGDGHIAVDPSSVYWVNSAAGTILRVPIAGGAVQTVASGQTQPHSVVLDSNGIYWYAAGIFALPTGQSTPVMLAPAPAGTPPIVVGGGYVYWYAPSGAPGPFNVGTIQRVPTGGGAVETVASQQSPYAMALVTGLLLYTEANRLMGLDL
jgi:hypothetical protein